MKSILLTTIAAVLVVGCGESDDIWTAAEEGNVEAVKGYLAAGTDVNAKDYNGDTPLHKAANEGHEEIAELLIAKGADVNAKDDGGNTPLHSAATKKVAELPIAEGADVNAWGGFGRTPLDAAIRLGRTGTADIIRKHGAKTGKELKAEGK